SATLREDLDQLDGAIAAWTEVLALDDGDREALGRLARIHERQSDWDALIRVLEQAALHAANVAEERALRTRIAVIYGDTMGRLDDAAAAWQTVLDVAPDAADALAALEQVHGRRGDWHAVQDVLVRRFELAEG